MINKSKVFFLVFIAVLCAVSIFWYSDFVKLERQTIQPTDSIESDASPSVTVRSYAYLFEEERRSMTSNIVGYFGYGAFAWYVPDWLANNWDMSKFGEQGMVFKPKIRENADDFSDIILEVSTSTELNNAENLVYTKRLNIPKDEIIINEVLLNKHTGDVLGIIIETNTRIYHLVTYTGNFRRITDMYFMDGNGKTLQVTFETKAEIFSEFSNKIRNLVEGIGELKSPQG